MTCEMCYQKEDMSDGEHSETMSSIPDSEGGPDPVITGVTGATTDIGDKDVRTPGLISPPGPGSLSPGALQPQPPRTKTQRGPGGPGGPTGQAGKSLTSLSNLSPTPKSMLTGVPLPLGSGDHQSRPQSSSSRSSCEYQQSPDQVMTPVMGQVATDHHGGFNRSR